MMAAGLSVLAQEAEILKKPRPMQPPHISAGFVDGSNCSVAWIRWKRKNDTAEKYQIQFSWIKKANPPMENFQGPRDYTTGQKNYYEEFVVPQKNRNGSDKLHVRILEIDANNDFIPSNTVPLKCRGEEPPEFEFWGWCKPDRLFGTPGVTVFSFHVKGYSDYGIKKIIIDYDDGNKQSIQADEHIFTHVYQKKGQYQPEATFIDNEGNKLNKSCCVITISDDPEDWDCTIKHLKYVRGFHAINPDDGRDFIRVYWEATYLNPKIKYLVFKAMYSWKDFVLDDNGDHKIKKRIAEDIFFDGADDTNMFDDYDLELNDKYDFDKGLVVVYTIIARCGSTCSRDRIVGGIVIKIPPVEE